MSRVRILCAFLVLAAGCDDDPPAGTDAGTPPPMVDAGPGEDLFRADCEALVPEYCALPFPSDYWLVDDSSTASGHRVNLGETTLPRSRTPPRQHSDPTPVNTRDGWSVNGSILAYLPGAYPTGLPDPLHIEDSLAADSPTVLIDAETGERVPHFAELDYSLLCARGFADCDDDPRNGCETDLYAPTSCGGCGITCGAGEVCSSNLCRSECQTGQTLVDGACIDDARAFTCGGAGFPCEQPPPQRTFIIRPVVPLEHEHRYVVGIRNVVNGAGEVIDAPAPFAALRDDTPSDVTTIEARRDHFEAIFTTLQGAGVSRSELQLAWDFTTGSLINDTGWLLSARDQALAFVGEDGPAFRVVDEGEIPGEVPIRDFTEEENANIRRRVNIAMTVPLFMDVPEAGGRIHLGADGMPEMNGTAEYYMVVNIPRSATPDTPARPIQYGHGLLGDRYQANAGWLAEFGNTNGFMPFGVDWKGMAFDDVAGIILALQRGQMQEFATVPERLVQGITNALLAMRLMLTGLGTHEAFQIDGRSVIDTSAGFYTGDSQGGIFGGTYMAVTTDVERGILGVPGQPYNLLLTRSIDFNTYYALLRQPFDDGPNIQIALAVMQSLWDRTEPGSYTRHIMNDPLPGTPSHQVILQPAIGDHQVTTLGAAVMARAIGAVTIAPQTRPIWGIEEVTGPHTGSAIVEFDFGLDPEPLYNIPPHDGDDPHGSVRRNPRALAQTLHFFQTGEIIHTCDGVCDPE
ncbi:MAG: hypothetical protein KC619_07865 [Myxococcales bacterium]|nr:hypothetical protein [Myxococcales bacterium]